MTDGYDGFIVFAFVVILSFLLLVLLHLQNRDSNPSINKSIGLVDLTVVLSKRLFTYLPDKHLRAYRLPSDQLHRQAAASSLHWPSSMRRLIGAGNDRFPLV